MEDAVEVKALIWAHKSFIAESLAKMIIQWVDGGTAMGTDWRTGLASVIELRLERLTKHEIAK